MNRRFIPFASATAISLLTIPGIAWSADGSPQPRLQVAQLQIDAECQAKALAEGLSEAEIKARCAAGGGGEAATPQGEAGGEAESGAEAGANAQTGEPESGGETQQPQPQQAQEPAPEQGPPEQAQDGAPQEAAPEQAQDAMPQQAEPEQAQEAAPQEAAPEQTQEAAPQQAEPEQMQAEQPQPRADQPRTGQRGNRHGPQHRKEDSQAEQQPTTAEPAPHPADGEPTVTEAGGQEPALEGEVEEIKPVAKETVKQTDEGEVRTQTFRTDDGQEVEKEMKANADGDKVIVTRTKRRDGKVVVRERVIEKASEDEVVRREVSLGALERQSDQDGRNRRDDGRRGDRRDRRRRDDGTDIRVIINVPVGITIPVEHYVVEGYYSSPELIRETLLAPPVIPVTRRYSVQEVVQSERLRTAVRRVDLDAITFGFDQAFIPADQLNRLDRVGDVLADILQRRPNEVFLLEGHTDAPGTDLYNLQLSELRAQAVKRALVQRYGISPDNLVTEGYGEEFLKVPTSEAERLNRRVTVRRITPLVQR
ncbi:MAG TPA: OmpA family protein [Hyphomicrobiales bacterium]|nr:OmpA family protein [Hyphomicrobiales bacterium]